MYGKKNGLSEAVERKLNSLHLHLLVTTILKLIVTSEAFNDELVNNMTTGIGLRNKIIHESKLDISEQEARNVLQNVRKMAGILMDDISQ